MARDANGRRFGALGAVLLLVLAATPRFAAAQGREVADWVLAAGRITDPRPNLVTIVLLTQTMHDALNAAAPRYSRWRPALAGEPTAEDADPQTTLHAAAHAVLLSFHPDRGPLLDRILHDALDEAPEGVPRERGIALGRAIAAAHLAARAADAPMRPTPFTASTLPGRWRPTPPDFSPGTMAWLGQVRPFALASPESVPLPAPLPAGSPSLARDLAEVRARGGATSATRTKAETEAAEFWASTPAITLWPRTTAALVISDPPGDLWRTTWAVSAMNTALLDTTIAGFAAKERLGIGRPITAIAEGWDGAAPDPAWQALRPTPDHPEYPAGHGITCAASTTAIQAIWSLPIEPFTVVTETGGKRAVRRFATVEAAGRECFEARILVGAHYRSTMEASERFGRNAATQVLAAAPKPLRVQSR